MFNQISSDVRDQILARVKEGKERVSVIASEFGISPRTIYSWLSKGIGGINRDQLELNKLKRENLQLKQIIGELMFEKSRGKKARHG